MESMPLAVIDCFGSLDDQKMRRYFEIGREVKGLGRGHVKRIKGQVREEKQQMLMQAPIQVSKGKI